MDEMEDALSLVMISPATWWSVGTSIAVLTLLLATIDLAAETWALPLDRRVSKLIISHRNREETRLMRFFSFLGGPFGLALFSVLFASGLVMGGRLSLAVLFLLCVVGATTHVLIVKLLTARKRPSLRVLDKERTYSFPSAHSLVSTVVYVGIGMWFRQMAGGDVGGWLLAGLVLLLLAVGSSRVYLGAHYLSDVLAGFLAGLLWTAIFTTLGGLW